MSKTGISGVEIDDPMANSAKVLRCFVVGHPISHSRSPLIHGHWLNHHGLPSSYERIDVKPEDLMGFVEKIRNGQFHGGNVTVPHKITIMPLLDGLTMAARDIGAVNTIYRDGSLLMGDNTDVAGFLAHLDKAAPGWKARTEVALVLGAGGAARAIVYGLRTRGVETILIANRDIDRARKLALSNGPAARAIEWGKRHDNVEHVNLIINTTSLGMKGQPSLELDMNRLRAGTHVYDIVYVPLKTPLLQAAQANGGVIIDGLGMLLHQAVPGFTRWFGVVPDVTPALRALIVASLDANP